jgi:NADH:ubiquinone oxidoreductase subunit B-like Fe-S oxidoreductase
MLPDVPLINKSFELCYACSATSADSAATYDLLRFGLRIVASPRHADIVFVTGAVTSRNPRLRGFFVADALRRSRRGRLAP